MEVDYRDFELSDLSRRLSLEAKAEDPASWRAGHRLGFDVGLRTGLQCGRDEEARRWFFRAVWCLLIGAASGAALVLGFQGLIQGERALRALAG